MLKEYLIKKYKNTLYNRTDDNGAVYYFSHNDFPNLNYKEYNFVSSKGDLLKGNFYYYDGFIENHIVVFDHGMGGGHLSYFKEIELLCKKGYMVYAYDHTGCMESGGDCSYGFSQSLVDLNDCLNSLKKDYPNYTFDCIGHSWGGFSTMNIAAFHKDIKHIVVISGFISVYDILKQELHGMFKKYYEDVIKMEEEYNGKFARSNGIDALSNYEGEALIIHSDTDKVINPKLHYYKLKEALKNKDNISFVLVKNKGHNPNYLNNAIKYKNSFLKDYMKALKHNKLVTQQQKDEFKNSYDWNKMTGQDMNVWKIIFKFLEK